jgi:DNA-binding transcriptional MocR family regulator
LNRREKSRWLSRRSQNIGGTQLHKAWVDQIVITTGCSQALHGMILSLTNHGDIVACEAPAYYSTLEIIGDEG